MRKILEDYPETTARGGQHATLMLKVEKNLAGMLYTRDTIDARREEPGTQGAALWRLKIGNTRDPKAWSQLADTIGHYLDATPHPCPDDAVSEPGSPLREGLESCLRHHARHCAGNEDTLWERVHGHGVQTLGEHEPQPDTIVAEIAWTRNAPPAARSRVRLLHHNAQRTRIRIAGATPHVEWTAPLATPLTIAHVKHAYRLESALAQAASQSLEHSHCIDTLLEATTGTLTEQGAPLLETDGQWSGELRTSRHKRQPGPIRTALTVCIVTAVTSIALMQALHVMSTSTNPNVVKTIGHRIGGWRIDRRVNAKNEMCTKTLARLAEHLTEALHSGAWEAFDGTPPRPHRNAWLVANHAQDTFGWIDSSNGMLVLARTHPNTGVVNEVMHDILPPDKLGECTEPRTNTNQEPQDLLTS